MARRKVKYDFDPLKGKRRGMSKTKQERIERKVAKFVQEKVTSMTEQSKSPVFGKKDFKELSPKYKDKKKAAGKGDKPNLRFNGELMSKVKVNRRTKTGGVRATVTETQQGKADGHNNFSGKSKLPRRPFIPDANRNEKWKAEIERGIAEIVDEEKDKKG